MFPEGTRTACHGVISLERRAANIAVAGRATARRVRFRTEVGHDISIEQFIGDGATDVMAARKLTDHLQNYFNNETSETSRHA